MYEKLKKDENKDTSVGIPLYNINEENNKLQQDKIKITVKNAEDPVEYIELRPSDKVHLLKSSILKIKNKPKHNLRIIYNGKMLRDDSMTLSDCKLETGSVVICSITEPIVFSNPTVAAIPNDNGTDTATTSPTTTNNRVQNNSYIPPEFVIEMGSRQQLGLESPPAQTTTLPNRVFGSSSPFVRDSIELTFGLLFGFFFGPISLFWITKEYLTRTTKMGIVFGVIFSVSLSLVRLSAQTTTI
ncbi:hypothetical protein DICPUDRAFT_148688 [Dictyostelium purpureum]|uniref:Ubiquitin-like domain-containing protein n=1 Tax=Dictyostelium purpureum TaxID=5786 RepID=F0ZBR3_DICPU|nr:uncharacterized protein DICPUDRAFT_148688 [Dictyostelium purpureum]EGC38664.1 hypothetical protein DICPUDRAFT_148688 [Dictyostelium purpureum]|eukprot:XP_003284857.1 hypothetical protein DICPUDRAFT_148688 [Dictyostelium purpureum]